MKHGAILTREASISAAFGRDFFPQAFMVSLMGSLVPALLLRRRVGGAARPILVRAVIFAVLGAGIAGGGAFAVCSASGAATLAAGTALILKAAFGAILGAVVTLCALLPLLPSETRS